MSYQKEKAKLPSGFIDLGEDLSEKYKGMDITSPDNESPKIHYPELRFETKELEKLPKEGIAIIKYRKRMEKHEKITRDGKEESRYVCEIEVHGIKACKNEDGECEEETEESEPMTNAIKDDNEDAIDKGLAAAAESPKK